MLSQLNMSVFAWLLKINSQGPDEFTDVLSMEYDMCRQLLTLLPKTACTPGHDSTAA
jgi:hypothetical protein